MTGRAFRRKEEPRRLRAVRRGVGGQGDPLAPSRSNRRAAACFYAVLRRRTPAGLSPDRPLKQARSWPGVIGLMAGTAALVAVGVGGVLVLDQLDGIQDEAQVIRRLVPLAKSDLRAEQRAALAPPRGDHRGRRSGEARPSAPRRRSVRGSPSSSSSCLPRPPREAELRASIEAVRALVDAEARRDPPRERARDADAGRRRSSARRSTQEPARRAADLAHPVRQHCFADGDSRRAPSRSSVAAVSGASGNIMSRDALSQASSAAMRP